MPTLLLAIDVGNTHTVAGLFSGDELKEHWRIATEPNATTDQLAAAFSSLLFLGGYSFSQIEQMIISSVVPPLIGHYEKLASRYLGTAAHVVGPGMKTGMPILTNNPHEVGADRIVNAVAALAELGNGPCIVVDFGTATTFDAISAGNEYLGGAIAPGIEVSLQALTTRAARLAQVDICEPDSVIGKTTDMALCSGMLFGFAGLVDGIITRMKAELGGGELKTLATGGFAGLVVPHTRLLNRVDPLLTLKGLKLLHKRNETFGNPG